MDNNTDIRDKLALVRTRLANERTFLAYIRTGLSLLGAAAVLFQFFSSQHSHVALAWVLAISGLIVLVLGLWRFLSVRTRLDRH